MLSNMIYLFIIALIGSSFHVKVLAQTDFDPESRLSQLCGEKENIGMAAGYAIDGQIHWTAAGGFSCLASESPFTKTTLTRIASIAKSFTAVAIMQLVEQDQLQLEASIDQYLPDLPPDKQKITVKQLLTHTAGISQYLGQEEIENTVNYKTLQEAMEVFIDRPLLFEPGTRYFYTTYGYVMLGRIIEEASGQTYGNYLRQNIFDVAGMNDTGIEEIQTQYQDKSCLYHHNGRKAKEGKQNDLSNRIPGGGFYSTLEDVMKFGLALLDGKLIDRNTLDLMLQSEPVSYDGNKYGLGWFFYGPAPHENLVIGHSGGQTGCTSQLMIVPKTRTVVVALSNTSGNYPSIATFASQLLTYSETN